jgi:hypothetical protein
MLACSKTRSFRNTAFALFALSAAFAAPLAAQTERTPANCTYESCALGLAPAWNGLAITRGIAQRQIAVLGFFYPDDIRPVFADNPQALEAAEEALRTRTVGAILTDAGLLLLGTGLARAAFQREFDGLSTALALTGGVSLGISVPFQLAADGFLSRAVWWHNRRFSR